MKALSRFVVNFTSLIVAVLACFDRVIFKGNLPLTSGSALEESCGAVVWGTHPNDLAAHR